MISQQRSRETALGCKMNAAADEARYHSCQCQAGAKVMKLRARLVVQEVHAFIRKSCKACGEGDNSVGSGCCNKGMTAQLEHQWSNNNAATHSQQPCTQTQNVLLMTDRGAWISSLSVCICCCEASAHSCCVIKHNGSHASSNLGCLRENESHSIPVVSPAHHSLFKFDRPSGTQATCILPSCNRQSCPGLTKMSMTKSKWPA